MIQESKFLGRPQELLLPQEASFESKQSRIPRKNVLLIDFPSLVWWGEEGE